MESELEKKARQFATKAHEGQLRKDGITPYIAHPEAVVALLRDEVGIADDSILSAAWLHDVVEDCDATVEELEREFNPSISRYVSALTKGESREDYLDRFRRADYGVQIIKLADVVHNCSCLFKGINEKTIRNKLDDCQSVFYDLALQLHPPFYDKLEQYLKPWRENFRGEARK
jgi:(p)ppGpp synthase/HD superfamily hydrolase